MVYEIYARHGDRCKREAPSVEAAIARLTHDNEFGECFPIAVYDAGTNELHVPGAEPADVHSSEFRLRFVRTVCGLPENHAFAAVHEGRFFPDYGD